MDTEGPVSVLDRRTRSASRDRVIADRITRQRSPGPAFRRGGRHRSGSQLSVDDVNASYRDANDENAAAGGGEGAEEGLVYRISQPYRTSFSAAHSVTWGRVARPVQPKSAMAATPTDRSRSLSPTASLRSNASIMSAPPAPYSSILHNSHYRPSTGAMYPADKRRPRGRSKSPKRVTYNTRVTVRHSDTEDNMFTQLSEGEDISLGEYGAYEAPLRPIRSPFARSVISPRYNEFSQLSPTPSVASTSSQVSYGPSSSTPRRYDIVNNSNDSINKHNLPPPLPPAQRRVRDVTNTAGRAAPQQHQQQQQHTKPLPPMSSSTSSLPPSQDTARSAPGQRKSTPGPVAGQQPEQRRPADYTSELVDLSQQITQMEWSPRQVRSARGRPPAGPSSHSTPNRTNHGAPAITTADQDPRNTNTITNVINSKVNTHKNYNNNGSSSSQSDGMLFSPPPGGTVTTATTSTATASDTEYMPYTTASATVVQSPNSHPVGILKDSRAGASGQDTAPQVQGQGQFQSGVISSGNGVVREGDIIGGRTSDSRSSPSKSNPFRGQAENPESPTSPVGGSTSRQYDHDRPFSFHKALRGDYGEDLQRLARDGLLSDYCPPEPDSADHLDVMDGDGGVVRENGGVPGRKSVPERIGPGKFPVPSDGTPSPIEDDSPDLGSPVEGGGVDSGGEGGGRNHRETEGTTSGRLTPSKRSVSLSISNFLKKFSPHLRRKPSTRSHNSSRERGGGRNGKSKSDSADGSAQSLTNTASDPETDQEQGRDKSGKGKGRFSRSQVRQSFMKLVGRSSSRSKKKKNKKSVISDSDDPATIPTPAHYTIEPHDPDCGVDASSADELDNINTHNGIILTTNNGTSVINTATRSNTSNNSNGRVMTSSSGGALDLTSVRIMNAIEKNTVAEQDIYRRFKDIQQHSSPSKTTEENPNNSSYDNPSPPSGYQTTTTVTTYPVSISNSSPPEPSSKLARPEPVRPSAGHYTPNYTTLTLKPDSEKSPPSPTHNSLSSDGPMDFFTESDISAILQAAKFETRSKFFEPLSPPVQESQRQELSSSSLSPDQQQYDTLASPPQTLDVGGFSSSKKSKKLVHLAGVGSISGDESIGDCSLDANLTASEPSLLSGLNQSSGSKQAVLAHSLVSSAEAKESDSVRLRRLTNQENDKENSEPLDKITPRSSRSDPPSPVDPSHKPSYLKLSCAVSGYGKYSRYSTYKDVNRRSPFSSQSSLRSEVSSPEPGSMPAERKSGDEGTPEHHQNSNHTSSRLSPALSPSFRGGANSPQAVTNNHKPVVSSATAVNGHSGHVKYPTGDIVKDGEYFLQHTQFEEDRIRGLCLRAEAHMRAHDLPEEACGLIRSAIGKANLLLTQKFVQFRELCQNHMVPDPDEPETLWGDLQGFWDMVKIQIDNVDDLFAEIELMRHNGWQEIPKQASRRSSASSSPKSGTISQASTPSATPGSKRKNIKPPGSGGSSKNTPDSSPERTQKARQAAKARDDARRKLLAERRAAMKQQLQQQQQAGGDTASVEIFVPDKK